MNLFEVSKKKKRLQDTATHTVSQTPRSPRKSRQQNVVANIYYLLIQMFLPFQWPRAHHVTCK